ncbi:MAG: pectate lyase [Gammaproteobacteria bacterium]|nr:pectate lyase [Gammaproteobacteria bacterium]
MKYLPLIFLSSITFLTLTACSEYDYPEQKNTPENVEGDNTPDDGDDNDDVAVPFSDGGFAGYNFTLTGGAGGDVVTVDNGVALQDALTSAKNSDTPVIIYVDGVITDANSGNRGKNFDIKDMDNVSIVGVEDRGELSGIGISIRRAKNVIIQNLKIHDVPASFGDAIGIEGDDETFTTGYIWIDHNELHGDLSVGKDDYDGLIDSKAGAEYITVSYNYIHDHYKSMLNGSSDDDGAGERFITYHHNHFKNLESRVPLFRYGKGHLYNNVFESINSTAINSRMGAELLIEGNVFKNVQNPIVSFYSREVGFWNVRDNDFASVTWTTPASGDTRYDASVGSTSTYEVPYDYASYLTTTSEVVDHVMANVGIGVISQSTSE